MEKGKPSQVGGTRKPVLVSRVSGVSGVNSKVAAQTKPGNSKIVVARKSLSTPKQQPSQNPSGSLAASKNSSNPSTMHMRSGDELELLRRSVKSLESEIGEKEKEFKEAVERNISIEIMSLRYAKEQEELSKQLEDLLKTCENNRKEGENKANEITRNLAKERELKRTMEELNQKKRELEVFAERERRISRGMTDYMDGFRDHMNTMSALLPIMILDASNGRIDPSSVGVQSNIRSSSNGPARTTAIRIIFNGRG